MTLLVCYAVAGFVVVGLGLESGRASGELGLRDRGQQGHEGGEGGSGESAGPVHVEDADDASVRTASKLWQKVLMALSDAPRQNSGVV